MFMSVDKIVKSVIKRCCDRNTFTFFKLQNIFIMQMMIEGKLEFQPFVIYIKRRILANKNFTKRKPLHLKSNKLR